MKASLWIGLDWIGLGQEKVKCPTLVLPVVILCACTSVQCICNIKATYLPIYLLNIIIALLTSDWQHRVSCWVALWYMIWKTMPQGIPAHQDVQLLRNRPIGEPDRMSALKLCDVHAWCLSYPDQHTNQNSRWARTYIWSTTDDVVKRQDILGSYCTFVPAWEPTCKDPTQLNTPLS